MTKDNKFSFIRNTPIHESASPKKERSSRRRQINPRKQRKLEAIAIYPEIYLSAPSNEEPDFSSPEDLEDAAAPTLKLEVEDAAGTEAEPYIELEHVKPERQQAQEPENIELENTESAQQQESKPPLVEEKHLQPQPIGRPRGRRSNADYEQVTAYIRRETYTAVKIALLQRGKTRGFSELVEELLIEHLQNSTPT